jgi:hypothetical protein
MEDVRCQMADVRCGTPFGRFGKYRRGRGSRCAGRRRERGGILKY